jgi:hypothetical protein
MKANKPRIGKLKPRYRFILNPHAELRLSSCPRCHKLTHPRKFDLLIHIESWGPLIVGKTCKYCSQCELIMCHQDELDEQLAQAFQHLDSRIIGNDYLVLGTVERPIWKDGPERAPRNLEQLMENTAEFKGQLELDYDPGGWRLEADHDSGKLIIRAADAAAQRSTAWTQSRGGTCQEIAEGKVDGQGAARTHIPKFGRGRGKPR